jgi:purine-binding chemotaxis protein CheW
MEMRPPAEFNGIVFGLGDVLYAVDAFRIREVLGGMDLLPLYVTGQSQGFLQSRGRTFPVVDLREVFSLPPAHREGPNSFIVVQAAEPGKVTALWVDRVVEMIAVPSAELKPLTTPVADVPSGFLSSMLIRGDKPVYLLSLDGVLSSPGSFEGEKPELKNLAG